MKILILNPVQGALGNEMQSYLKTFRAENCEIIFENLPRGPEAIENYTDELRALDPLLDVALKMGSRVDGMILNCFFDPGVTALREALEIPVIGVAESSLLTALLSKEKVGVIAPLAISKPITEKQFRAWGQEDKLVDVYTFPLEVQDLYPPKKDVRQFLDCGVRVLKEKGAEAIILGCTELFSYHRDLQEKHDVKIIEPLINALKITETLIELKLSHPNIYKE